MEISSHITWFYFKLHRSRWIYDTEDDTTVEKFLKESTANKNKIAITTDLDKKYASINPKLGFKHQLCIFHTKKSLNKQLKTFKDKNRISDEEYQECHKQLKMIKDLFDLNDYDEFKNEVQSLIYRKYDFHPVIYKIIRKSITPRYKSFIYHLKDKRIEKTSNKIENAFQKTMPKSRKRTFKTKRGVLKRIYRRDLIWNDNRKKDFENQQSFWKSHNYVAWTFWSWSYDYSDLDERLTKPVEWTEDDLKLIAENYRGGIPLTSEHDNIYVGIANNIEYDEGKLFLEIPDELDMEGKGLSPKVDVLLKDKGDSFGIDTMSLIDVGVTKHPRKIWLLNSEITGETGNPEPAPQPQPQPQPAPSKETNVATSLLLKTVEDYNYMA